jgi:acyl dehydratase
MITAPEPPVFTYDRFVPGTKLGSIVEQIEPALLEAWRTIYESPPRKPDGCPAGLMSVLAMRAYLGIVSPRPPGNIHAGQVLRACKPLRTGQMLRISVTCQQKIMKQLRRFVILAVRADDIPGNDEVFTGQLTMIWAA